MARKHDAADTIGEAVYDYISGDHGFAQGPDDLAAAIRPLLKAELARRDAIIRAWMPIAQGAIDAQRTDEAYRDGECSSARVALAHARTEAAMRLRNELRRLAPDMHPDRVGEEIG